MSPKLHRIALRVCLVLLILLAGNLVRTVWQQQASIDLAIAKGQQMYLMMDGQPTGLSEAQLSNLDTAVSDLIFVDAQPITLAEARPWQDVGCTANICAHLTYFDRVNGRTVNQILLITENRVLAEWQDALSRPGGSRFVAKDAIQIAANDPQVTAVLGDIGTGDPAMIPMSA
ncbi:MAG: hypothetical protein KC445_12225, partial [Anaerolineales bacterium]|nr:hypothetical protein [Anaerolineales bacterium]